MSTISIIVAIDLNNGIGKNNKLLCYLPNDLKHFKEVTLGHSIIMGRKTFESLPNGALPGRKNIVLTKDQQLKFKDCISSTSLEEAINLTRDEEQVFIIGGASLYDEAIDIADNLYITHINHLFNEADTFFPKIDLSLWKKVSEHKQIPDEKNKYEHIFVQYKRIIE